MSKRGLHDPLALEIARDLEGRGFPTDVEEILAKFRPAADDTARDALRAALRAESRKQYEQIVQNIRQLVTIIEQLTAAQPRQRAVDIRREITARADELRRRGVRDPVTRAEKEIAERLGHASGPSLNRWLRRHR